MIITDAHTDPEAEIPNEVADRFSRHQPDYASTQKKRRSPSMHEGIAVWCDCCTCEAEPYWVEIAEAMGMEVGSDYEDPDR